MIRGGEITDAKSVAALLWVEKWVPRGRGAAQFRLVEASPRRSPWPDPAPSLASAGGAPAPFNRSARRAAQQLCSERAKLEIFELEGIPSVIQDDDSKPPARVGEFKQRGARPTRSWAPRPEYDRAVPGPLKNAID